MNRKAIYLLMFLLLLSIVPSCIEEGYNWNDVDKEGAFSHENGLSLKLGDFDTVRVDLPFDFDTIWNIPEIPEKPLDVPDEVWDEILAGILDSIKALPEWEAIAPEPTTVSAVHEIEDIFSDDMYRYFVYDNKGKDEPLGDIRFEADFISGIKNADSKGFTPFTIDVSILKENGDDVGIHIATQEFAANKYETPQDFLLEIRKEDIVKLKDARHLRFTVTVTAQLVDMNDFLLISNIWLKLHGGVSLSL